MTDNYLRKIPKTRSRTPRNRGRPSPPNPIPATRPPSLASTTSRAAHKERRWTARTIRTGSGTVGQSGRVFGRAGRSRQSASTVGSRQPHVTDNSARLGGSQANSRAHGRTSRAGTPHPTRLSQGKRAHRVREVSRLRREPHVSHGKSERPRDRFARAFITHGTVTLLTAPSRSRCRHRSGPWPGWR